MTHTSTRLASFACSLRFALICGILLGLGITDSLAINAIWPAYQIGAGDRHVCVVSTSGGVQCWGDNLNHQLGNAPPLPRPTPYAVDTVADAVWITGGTNHTCALLSDRRIKCWGINNYYGQLGDGSGIDSAEGVLVSGITTAMAIDAGGNQTCALLDNGEVWCWGNNDSGQLGDGTTTIRSTPVRVQGMTGATAISVGLSHACAIITDGSARCWGLNGAGQLGDNSNDNRPLAVNVADLAGATQISAGNYHTCALLGSGGVRCWGGNYAGQLGNGTGASSYVPVAVTDITTAKELATGQDYSCALLTDGTVKCWGYNGDKTLGDGTTTQRNTPVSVVGLTDALRITAGNDFACVSTTSGGARCWGHNGVGQLGNGATMDNALPTSVIGLTSPTAIASGNTNTCAIDNLPVTRIVKCWGDDSNGLLLTGLRRTITPIPIANSENADEISIGNMHGCLRTGSTIKCWGANWSGQLGNGGTNRNPAGAGILAVSLSATQISAGSLHTCAVTTSGAVFCWGNNYFGQIGNGNTSDQLTPIQVIASGATAVAAGAHHTCAVVSGAVKCWGYNLRGQLGNGTNNNSTTPVTVAGITDATAVAAGQLHSCAVVANGYVKCWGSNDDGELGDGTTVNDNAIHTVSYLGSQFTIGSRATKLALGKSLSCARVTTSRIVGFTTSFSGSIQCWGKNTHGQLGNGSTTNSSTPVLSLGDPVAAGIVAAGSAHACGLSGGSAPYTAKCWGAGLDDQLGNGVGGYAPQAVSLLRQPAAPTITGITPVSRGTAMRISFTPPADNGGDAITGYIAYCALDQETVFSASGPGSPLTVSGLTKGATYTCWVKAANDIGAGSSSATIVKVTKPVGITPILSTILD